MDAAPPSLDDLAPGSSASGWMFIQPAGGWIGIGWAELARYRELLLFLVWRDLKIRYKQTTLGLIWAVLPPVFQMVVFAVIFGRFAQIPSEGQPYAVFVYAGLLPWCFFANGVSLAGQSLVNQQPLLTKVYFPRLLVPTAHVGAGLVDLVVGLAVYAAILVGYGITPSSGVALLPLLVLVAFLATLGFGYALAALTVLYRDFRHVIPFLLQALLILSPVVYPVSLVPERYRWALYLNPMSGVIDGFRAAILGRPWDLAGLAISCSAALGAFCLGALYFRRVERHFADLA